MMMIHINTVLYCIVLHCIVFTCSYRTSNLSLGTYQKLNTGNEICKDIITESKHKRT